MDRRCIYSRLTNEESLMIGIVASFIVGCLIIQILRLSKENQELKAHQIHAFQLIEKLGKAITDLKQ